MKQPVFTGSCTALITPFAAGHAVDYPALAGLLDCPVLAGSLRKGEYRQCSR